MPGRGHRWSTLLLLLAACGPAVDTDDASTSQAGSSSGSQTGQRPSTPGTMYSLCETVADCDPLEYCVFPPGEAGFCTAACVSEVDVSACDLSPGGRAVVGCLDLDMPDGALVCALYCDDGGCPGGMRCEGVDTVQGAQQICF